MILQNSFQHNLKKKKMVEMRCDMWEEKQKQRKSTPLFLSLLLFEQILFHLPVH